MNRSTTDAYHIHYFLSTLSHDYDLEIMVWNEMNSISQVHGFVAVCFGDHVIIYLNFFRFPSFALEQLCAMIVVP